MHKNWSNCMQAFCIILYELPVWHLCFRDVRRSEGVGGRAKQRVPRPAFPVSANFAGRSPLGRQRKNPTQFRISHRLPFAAAPALLGMAAAITLSAQMTSPAYASTMTRHAASAGQSWKVANAELLAAIHPVATQQQATVRKPTAAPASQVHGPVGRHPQHDRPEGLPRPERVASPLLGQPGQDPVGGQRRRGRGADRSGQARADPGRPFAAGADARSGPRAGQHPAGGHGAAGVGRGFRARAEREHLHRLRLVPGVRDLAPSPVATARS